MESRENDIINSTALPGMGNTGRESIFHSNPNFTVLIDANGNIVDANPVALTNMNLSLTEATQLDWIGWMSAASRGLFFNCVKRVLNEKISIAAVEVDITLPGQQPLSYELDFTPSEDQKTPHTLYVMARNQTERKKTERELRESQARYQALVENSPDIFFQVDMQGKIVYASPSIAQLRITPATITGQNLLDILSAANSKPALAALERAQNGCNESFDHSFTIDGEGVRLLHVTLQPIIDGNRQVGVRAMLSELEPARELDYILEKRAAQLATLNQIGREIASALDLEKVLQNAADLLHARFGYYHVAVFTQDETTGDAVMRARAGEFSARFPIGHHLPAGLGMVGWVFANGQSLLSNNVNQESSYINLYPELIPCRSELTVPIVIRSKIAGALDVQSPSANAFAEDDVRVIETVASQLAVAIANALLYATAQERLCEKQQAEELLRLQRDMLAAVGQALNFQDALDQILLILNPMKIFDSGSIYLVDASGGMRAAAHAGLTPEFAAAVTYLPAEANKTRFIHLGKPGYMRYTDLNYDQRIPSVVRQNEAMLSLAMLPILRHDKVIACLTLGSHLTPDIPGQVRYVLEATGEQLGAVFFRLKVERDLTTSLAYDQALLDASPDLMFISDRLGRILAARSPAESAFGPSDTLVGRRIAEIFPPAIASCMMDFQRRALDTRAVQVFEYQNQSEPGRIAFFETHISATADNQVVTIVRDITHLKSGRSISM